MFVTSVSEPSYRKAEKPQSVQQGCKPGAAPEAQLGSQHSSSGLSDGKEDRIPCLCSRQRRGMQAVKAPSCKEAIPSQGFPGGMRSPVPAEGAAAPTCHQNGNSGIASWWMEINLRQHRRENPPVGHRAKLTRLQKTGCPYGPHFYTCDPSNSAWALKYSICECMLGLKLKIY